MNSSWFLIVACCYDKCLNTNASCKTLVIHVHFFLPFDDVSENVVGVTRLEIFGTKHFYCM